ncbi:hypothetical protein [Desulfoluna spongiiphila]|uniref:Uncharacterized protein n=1 Tax=Desulfoluna spongiiphila TaxID=419481 RepID=A0A1G5C305_9BACT|nr:hypothetical protein [Desulfoluna spongiiphila]SCX96680.1 hypothetical protein SAMN05216233_102338 [Desulfoluna spongiiphila]VVS94074.1 hypothetical protein DBB_36460 [Desulfoluna spongiiphila]
MNRAGAGTAEKKNMDLSNQPGTLFVWSLLFLCLAAAFFVVMVTDMDLYVLLVKESAYTELLTAILYLASGVIFFVKGYQVYRDERSLAGIVFYLLFGLMFVFIAGEEESWGQWMFSYEVPDRITRINVQNELNVHNMAFFSKYSHIFNTHRLLVALAGTLFLVIPLLNAWIPKVRSLLTALRFPVAPLLCAPLFVVAVSYEKVAMLVLAHWSHAEIAEFFYSIGFFLYALSVYTEAARKSPEPAAKE